MGCEREEGMKEQHLLVDYENVQPTIEDLLKLAPKLTDVWLFHGPNQAKRAEALKSAHDRVILVPHSGKGKNALDFHLSFYLGYVAAKHPEANLMVVANDKGYDSMIGHAKLLGFTAMRVGFKAKKAPAAKKAAAPTKKAVAAKVAKPVAKKAAAPAAAAAPVQKQVPSPDKKVPAKKQAAAKQAPAKNAKAAPAPQKKAKNAGPAAMAPPVKKAPAKSAAAGQAAAAKKAAAKKAPAKKVPAKKQVAAKQAPAKQAPAKQAPVTKVAAGPEDKVMTRATKALSKMGKNRPTKLSKLLRHLKSMVGQGATEADADALSRRLEAAKVIQVVGDLVLYP
jgi:chemotaxis protein histidine kinase CheA